MFLMSDVPLKTGEKVWILCCQLPVVFIYAAVADSEGGVGHPEPPLSRIGQNLAKLAPFLPILASMPPN